jgi:hypothetical protein
MIEAIAIVGVVASISQLIQYGSKVLTRLDEFQSSLGDIPEVFRHVKSELPVLLDTLEQTKDLLESGTIRNETKSALLPAIEGCQIQIELLNDVIERTFPLLGDSWSMRSKKAVASLRQEAKVARITTILRGYIQTLTYYHAATSTSLMVPLLIQSDPLSPTSLRSEYSMDQNILSEIRQISSIVLKLGNTSSRQLAMRTEVDPENQWAEK